MTRLVGLVLLSLLLVQYVTSEERLERQERRAQRKQKALKPVPGCEWKLSECNPKKGRCGKGLQTSTLTGSGCPFKVKRVRCKIPCRAEARGPIKGLSPSEAGLKGEAVSSSVSSLKNKPSKACKYSKGSWSECNPITYIKERKLTLKKGDPSTCEQTKTVSRRCKKGKRGRKKKKNKKKKKNRVGKAKGCKYTRADWSECNIASDSRTRVLTLRKGDPNKCQPTITVTRKCKKPCRYTRGQWSDCDSSTLMKTRFDQLKTGNSETICDKTRKVTKPCKIKDKSKCKYDITPWSECDPLTKERTRKKVLLEGGPACQDKKTIRRSCQKNNGEERCFFGPWGEFNECRNGVKTKIRAVISGPDTCQRKAVKMRPCRSGNGN